MNNLALREFFSWWSSELAAMIPSSKLASAKKNRGGIIVDLSKHSSQLIWNSESMYVDCGRHFKADYAIQEYNKLVAQNNRLEVSSCDIKISREIILQRLISLPMATEEDIESVLAFEIDRYTPFKKDDVYFDVKIQQRDKAEKKISVLLSVAKKQILNEVLEFCRSCNLSINQVYTNNDSDNASAEQLSFVGGFGLGKSQKVQSSVNKYLLILVICLGSAALVIPIAKNFLNAQKYELEMSQQANELAEVKELLSVYKKMNADAKRASALFADKIKVITLLNELTEKIPDDTSLGRFSLEEGIIRIQGVSSSASRLISILDSSDSFSEVGFVAPVTQNSDTGKENFTIEIKLNLVEKDNASKQQ